MRRFAKKPANLKDKILLAKLIKAKCKRVDTMEDPPHLYYWRGVYDAFGRNLRVYFQNYANKPGVDFVDIMWHPEGNKLTAKERRELFNKLSTHPSPYN